MTLTTQDYQSGAKCAARVSDYMARVGLFPADFAQRAGIDEPSLRGLIRGHYQKVSQCTPQLITKINAYIEAHPVADSADVNGELYSTDNVRIIRETFQALIPRPVAYVIYAPPGSQKSFVLEHEVARLNASAKAAGSNQRAVYIYPRNDIRPRDLMRRIAIACGARTANDIDPMLEDIRHEFRGMRVLIVIDEAQWLSLDCLELIRELLDQPPYCSLLLAGSHDLKKTFDKFSASLEQWNSRIIAKVKLPGLQRAEAVGIIQREIGDLLDALPTAQADAQIDTLIAGATTRDAFDENRAYINVRTLTNALNQIRAATNSAA